MKKVNSDISGLIREIGLKTKNIADSNLLGTGLNSKQAKMIAYIYKHQEEGVIQNDLAKKFNKTKASITSMLQGLEKKGYIKRVVQIGNERQKNIYVLDKGIALIEEFKSVFDNIELQMYKSLSEEESQTLKKLLDKVNKNL